MNNKKIAELGTPLLSRSPIEGRPIERVFKGRLARGPLRPLRRSCHTDRVGCLLDCSKMGLQSLESSDLVQDGLPGLLDSLDIILRLAQEMVYEANGLAEKLQRLGFEEFPESTPFLCSALETMAAKSNLDRFCQCFHAGWIVLDSFGTNIGADDLKPP